MQSLGGKCLCEYVVWIADLPDMASAAAVGVAASASGVVRTRTTQRLTAQELDQTLAKGVNYPAPRQ